MATGILGAINTGTLIYTAPVDSKLVISATGSNTSSLSLNGVAAGLFYPTQNWTFSHFVGAGQMVTISASSCACIVSVLEGT